MNIYFLIKFTAILFTAQGQKHIWTHQYIILAVHFFFYNAHIANLFYDPLIIAWILNNAPLTLTLTPLSGWPLLLMIEPDIILIPNRILPVICYH